MQGESGERHVGRVLSAMQGEKETAPCRARKWSAMQGESVERHEGREVASGVTVMWRAMVL
jgi:hypothetical protein